MRSNVSHKLLIGIGIGVLVLCGFLFFSKINRGSENIITPVVTTNFITPSHILIPKINVDAGVESVGLTKDNLMDAPKGPDDTGWFSLGTHPGEIGSAVIDGHSGWKGAEPAVFDNLQDLKIGDKIYVEDKDGVSLAFVVREVKIYDKDADTTDVFTSKDGRSHLNLITCGPWNYTVGYSPNRVVVFADKE
jgi:sortase A